MHRRLPKLLALVAALALLAFGAATLASGGSKTAPLKSHPAAQVKTAADGDNIQQGDQTAPDNGAAAAEAPADTAAAAETPGVESATTRPDADQAAQDAACKAAGINSGGANVQYDGSTCSNG